MGLAAPSARAPRLTRLHSGGPNVGGGAVDGLSHVFGPRPHQQTWLAGLAALSIWGPGNFAPLRSRGGLCSKAVCSRVAAALSLLTIFVSQQEGRS